MGYINRGEDILKISINKYMPSNRMGGMYFSGVTAERF
jgi:hypothetical protein